jgi:hypothetical protein
MIAPYVMGQIDYAMNKENYITVLLGFNPIEFARNVPIENWNQTCFSVTQALHQKIKDTNTDPRHFILNPAVGPGTYSF